jgi:Kazal-type serine protease inhibitor domain
MEIDRQLGLVIVLGLCVYARAVAGLPEENYEEGVGVEPDLTFPEDDCKCEEKWEPVCSNQDGTYENQCHIDCAIRHDTTLSVAYQGVCQGFKEPFLEGAESEVHETVVAPDSDPNGVVEPETNEEAEPQTDYQAEPPNDDQAEPPNDDQAEPQTDYQAEPQTDDQAEPQTDYQAEPQTDDQAEPQTDYQAEPQTDYQAEPQTDYQAEPQTDGEAEPQNYDEAEPAT